MPGSSWLPVPSSPNLPIRTERLGDKLATGVWVEFGHIGPTQQAIAWHRECVRFMEDNNLLGRTLISQDAVYCKPRRAVR